MSTRKIRNLAVFALLALLTVYLAVDASLAWGYVSHLTHPGCSPAGPPLVHEPPAQTIRLQTADDLTLNGYYYPPRNQAVILALGGLGGGLGSDLPPIGFLLDEGYGVLQVGSRACAKPPAAVTIGAKELLDAEAGLKFLQSQPDVQKIGAFGFSMGGVTAIRTTALHPSIQAVVAEGGYYNMGRDFVADGQRKPWMETVFLYTVAGAFRLQTGANPFEISPVDDIARISPRPVLLIYGSLELGSGRGDLQYAAARQPKELWVVPGGAHGTNYRIAEEEYRRRVLEFFKDALLK